MRSTQDKLKVWISMCILIAVLLSMGAAAFSVSLIKNTPYCLDCETIYQICEDSTQSKTETGFYVSFYEDKDKSPVYRQHTLNVVTSKTAYKERQTYKESEVTTQVLNNVSGKIEPRAEVVIVPDKVILEPENIISYESLSKSQISEKLRASIKGDCFNISVKAILRPGEAVDNVITLDGVKYSEWVWWNGSYPYRLPISCAFNESVPQMVNGSRGFTLPSLSGPENVWIRCNQTAAQAYLYYADDGSYSIATETALIPYEVENGTGTSYNSTDIWSDYLGVFHHYTSGVSLVDSTANAHSTTQATPTNASDFFDGGFQYLNSEAARACMDHALTTTAAWTNELFIKLGSKYQYNSFFGSCTAAGSCASASQLLYAYDGTGYKWGTQIAPTDITISSANKVYFLQTMNTSYWQKLYMNGTAIQDLQGIQQTGAYLCAGTVTANTWKINATWDEWRISQKERSAAYAGVVYSNWQSYPGYGSLGELEISCVPNWSCSSFANCSIANVSECLAVSDSESCGIGFTGNLSDYDESCIYCAPSWACTEYTACGIDNLSLCLTMADLNLCGGGIPENLTLGNFTLPCTYVPPAVSVLGDFKDLRSMQGVIFFFILVFLWLALLVITLMFRNFATGSMFWLLGVGMGLWISQVGYVWAIGFLLLDTAIFLTIGRYS